MRRTFAAATLWALSVTLIVAGFALPSEAATTVTDLEDGITPTDLANLLAGPGVTVSNVTYTGANVAAGTFTGAASAIGFDSGVVLGTGRVQTEGVAAGECFDENLDGVGVEGPNDCEGNTTDNDTNGDAQLSALAGAGQDPPVASLATFDAAVLEFDFVPQGTTLTFSYVFSSEEYNEFVNSDFNDVFAFYVNGTNCALVPGTTEPVSINTINAGNPFGSEEQDNPQFYRNNDLNDPGPPTIDIQADGLTTVLTCTASVNPGQTNHIKLAIADASDDQLDSNVFIAAGTFSAPTTTTSTSTTTTSTTTTSTSTTTTTAPTTTTTSTSTTTTTAPTTTTTTSTSTTTTTAPTTTTTAGPTTTSTSTSTTTPGCDAPKGTRPGHGFGDKNHCHTGPPGQSGDPGRGRPISSSPTGPRALLFVLGTGLAVIALFVTGVPKGRRP